MLRENLLIMIPTASAISEFYETEDNYRSTMEDLGLLLPDRLDIRELANEFKRAVKEVVSKDVFVPIYDIQQFFY